MSVGPTAFPPLKFPRFLFSCSLPTGRKRILPQGEKTERASSPLSILGGNKRNLRESPEGGTDGRSLHFLTSYVVPLWSFEGGNMRGRTYKCFWKENGGWREGAISECVKSAFSVLMGSLRLECLREYAQANIFAPYLLRLHIQGSPEVWALSKILISSILFVQWNCNFTFWCIYSRNYDALSYQIIAL